MGMTSIAGSMQEIFFDVGGWVLGWEDRIPFFCFCVRDG